MPIIEPIVVSDPSDRLRGNAHGHIEGFGDWMKGLKQLSFSGTGPQVRSQLKGIADAVFECQQERGQFGVASEMRRQMQRVVAEAAVEVDGKRFDAEVAARGPHAAEAGINLSDYKLVSEGITRQAAEDIAARLWSAVESRVKAMERAAAEALAERKVA